MRESRELSRTDLVDLLPSGITDRTLLSYEHGARTLSVPRFIEICKGLGVAATEILEHALEKARDLRALSIKVDLKAIQRDVRGELEPVRRWVRNRLRDEPDTSVVLLPPVTIREMAAAFGLSHTALATYLVEFAPGDPR